MKMTLGDLLAEMTAPRPTAAGTDLEEVGDLDETLRPPPSPKTIPPVDLVGELIAQKLATSSLITYGIDDTF
jgi:hypothetical protein